MKIFFLIILLSASSFAQSFEGEVVKITDADTIDFKHSDGNIDRARLIGIDAPEVAHSKREISQPFGEFCKKLVENLTSGKTVKIETSRRDGYGRNLSRIFVGQTEINLLILNAGCAWLYYPNAIPATVRESYQSAFENARLNKIGLFARTRPVTPSTWRKRKHFKKKNN